MSEVKSACVPSASKQVLKDTFYHGTSEDVALTALKKGLKPRAGRVGVWKDKLKSNPSLIYLTNNEEYASQMAEKATAKKGEPVIVVLRLRPEQVKLLMADEDYLEKGDMPNDWQKTYCRSGSIGIRGKIRPSQIITVRRVMEEEE